MILLALALQAAAAPPAPAPREWSILVDPCASARDDAGKDIVVCGRPETVTPRLPLPRFRGPPDRPMPSNPDMKASVALDGPGIGNECGAYGEGCPVGFGGAAIPALVGGAVDLVKGAFAKRPNKSGRVPIPLDEAAPLVVPDRGSDRP